MWQDCSKKIFSVALLAILLAGCGSEPGESTSEAIDAYPSDATALSVMSDGVVTVEEYQGQFALFVECAEDVGGLVETTGTDATTGLINFRIRVEPDTERDNAVNACYGTHFIAVEQFFQVNDAAVLADLEAADLETLFDVQIPCLEENDVDYAVPESTTSPEYEELVAAYVDLLNSGQCELDG